MTPSDDGKVVQFKRTDESDALTTLDQTGNRLVWFDTAYKLLQKCVTVDEVKEIHDKARALETYLKQSQKSLDLQNMAAEIRIRAQRRGGEILAQMEKHPPGPPKGDRSHDGTDPPRLVDLGMSKNQSSRWQRIAGIPEEDFDDRVKEIKETGKELTSKEFLSLAGYLQREREREGRREKAAQEAENIEMDDRIRILCGDFREVLTEEIVPAGSVSLVLTDLPYSQEYLGLWDSLGQLAQRVLKEGGILAAYSGCSHLPEVLEILGRPLVYCWTAALVNEAFADTIFHPLRVKSLWKPIVLFSNGRPETSANENPSLRYLKDVINGDGLGNLNKEEHPWQQGVGEAGYLIDVLSLPGELVLDPCCGTGTTALACKRTGRRFAGAEVSPETCALAIHRVMTEGLNEEK